MKNKKVMILVASILGVLLVVGVSYAWLTLTVTGTKTNVIKAGSLSLTLDDTTSNGINLLETFPVLDEVGLSLNGYTFTLKNDGTTQADYTIYLDDEAMQTGETKMSRMDWIRYNLSTNSIKGTTSTLFAIEDTTTTRKLDTGVLQAGETKRYELKLWLGEDATNEIMGTVYRGKLRIEAVQSSAVASIPNAPELDDGMIPVVYDEASSSWKKADTSSEWYNYDKQSWANVVTVYETNRASLLASPVGTEIPMTDINTMWVWIPRYSYTIGNTYGVQLAGGDTPSKLTPGAIDIKFQKKTDTLENGIAKYTGSTPTNWYTHPAFCFGTLTTVDNRTTCDGDELNGIWVSKFETGAPETDPCTISPSTTNCNKNTLSPVSKPNISSWRYAQVANMFTAVKNNMNGSNGAATYGFNEAGGDSHMMKNMEWGAVAYLSQSKYGKYGNASYTGVNKEIYINNYISAGADPRSTMTGCSSGAPSTAESVGTCAFTYDKVADRGSGTGSGGAGSSTTGNISGIYDMSGAGYEYVMGNFTETVGSSGFSSVPEAKYYDKYTGTIGYKGDATNADGTGGWYADYANFVHSSWPWFVRGGHWAHTTNAGVFYFSRYSGSMGYNLSFRLVRAPLV